MPYYLIFLNYTALLNLTPLKFKRINKKDLHHNEKTIALKVSLIKI